MDNQQSPAFKPKTDFTTDNPNSQTPQAGEQSSAGGLGDKVSSAAGGSTEGSADTQSYLDKGEQWILWAQSLRMLTRSQSTGISYLQQSITGQSGQTKETSAQGDTSHHAAVDEAHPDKISEFLRDQHRSDTGEDRK